MGVVDFRFPTDDDAREGEENEGDFDAFGNKFSPYSLTYLSNFARSSGEMMFLNAWTRYRFSGVRKSCAHR